MTGYTKELQRHLAAYKQSRLGVREAGPEVAEHFGALPQ